MYIDVGLTAKADYEVEDFIQNSERFHHRRKKFSHKARICELWKAIFKSSTVKLVLFSILCRA